MYGTVSFLLFQMNLKQKEKKLCKTFFSFLFGNVYEEFKKISVT